MADILQFSTVVAQQEPLLSAGIGRSDSRMAEEAGREAAANALAELPDGRADLVIVFATVSYSQPELLQSVAQACGGARIAGCSSSGTIAWIGPDESSHSVAVLALASKQLRFENFLQSGLRENSHDCGRRLAEQIQARNIESEVSGKLLLIFADGVAGSMTEFLSGLESNLRFPVVIAGGTAGDLQKLDRTWQYHDGNVTSDSVSAVLVHGDFIADVSVTQGCEPIGKDQTVTRAENGWIHEIDGEPAWKVYEKYLAVGRHEKFSMGHSCFICLAEPLSEADPEYGKYIIRCPLQLDQSKGALFFPGDIRAGTRVRLALRDPEQCVIRAENSARKITERHPGLSPALVLQFDCCCRGRLLFGSDPHKIAVEPLQKIVGKAVPWFGFSTYGEIAPLASGKPYFHNYSTVLCAIYPKKSGH